MGVAVGRPGARRVWIVTIWTNIDLYLSHAQWYIVWLLVVEKLAPTARTRINMNQGLV